MRLLCRSTFFYLFLLLAVCEGANVGGGEWRTCWHIAQIHVDTDLLPLLSRKSLPTSLPLLLLWQLPPSSSSAPFSSSSSSLRESQSEKIRGNLSVQDDKIECKEKGEFLVIAAAHLIITLFSPPTLPLLYSAAPSTVCYPLWAGAVCIPAP